MISIAISKIEGHDLPHNLDGLSEILDRFFHMSKLYSLYCRGFTLALLALLLPDPASAQVSVQLKGPDQADNCGRITLTNTIVNTGGVLSGLIVTNALPSDRYAYVPGRSVLSLPGGITLTNSAADPDINNNSTNLI